MSDSKLSESSLRAAIDQGNAARRAGQLDEALAAYRRALAIASEDAEANSLFGLALLHQGKPDEAEPHLIKAVKINPEHIGFRLNLAELFERLGLFEKAIAEMERVVAGAPEFARGWERLANCCIQGQRISDAFEHYGRAAAHDPNNHWLALKWGRAALSIGRLSDARKILDRAARLSPGNDEIIRTHADVAEALADWASLERIARSWTILRPEESRAWQALSKALWESGHLRQAMEFYRKAIDKGGRDAVSLATYGRLSLMAMEFDESAAALEEAEALAPLEVHVLSAKALLLTMLGRFEEAETYCRRCLAVDAEDVTTFKVLNGLKRGRFSDDEKATLLRLSQKQDLRIEHRISAAFVLADTLDAQDKFDDAFAAYGVANDLGRQQSQRDGVGYDASNREAQIDSLIAWFPSKLPPTQSDAVPCPIFIVGMPRSGTTLVESVFAAHPQVFACGERLAMRQIMSDFFSKARVSGLAGILDESFKTWAKAFGAELPDLKGASHITDKNPWNFDAVGLIVHLFPNAKIIHARRNPVETGLSIFCNEFSKFSSFAHRLEDIGHYYGQYARLMSHWDKTLGSNILTVQYEDFVADFDNAAPTLLAACGLQHDNAGRDLLKTDRPIATLSAVQVRQGLTPQRGRAANYASHVVPLVRALEAAGIDLVTGALHS
ncbi:MAG: sulfotransferase [Micropepsaceae bacterium]